jgi:hypothetical protein
VRATAWEQADGLFRDERWRGSDDGYSVPLGGDRTLWLFGDTFVSRPGGATRVGSSFIRNSAAVQHGLDPLDARMEYAWGGSDDSPAELFPGDGPGTPAEWLWPVHGVHHDGRLLLFFMACDLPPGGDAHDPLGVSFRVTGWRAYTVDNPADPLADWHLARVEDRPETRGAVLGTALLVEDGLLYSWAHRAGTALLARIPVDAAVRGDLSSLQWWTGHDEWRPDAARAAVAVAPGLTEFTVHRLDDGRLCLVDVWPVLTADAAVNVRWAERPEGPWTEREPVYAIPEAVRDDAFVYAGKAHPELAGPGLAMTYASNGKDLAKLYHDESLYYPRFVTLEL